MIVLVLDAMFREDPLAAVGLERQASSKVDGDVSGSDQIDVMEPRIAMRSRAQIELLWTPEGLFSDLRYA